MIIKLIDSSDLITFKNLLAENKLPNEDIGSENQIFWGSWEDNLLVGGIGVEIYGQVAILRSMVVDETYRNQQIAGTLYTELLEYCIGKGILQLFLLTSTAKVYFERKGWSVFTRDNVPDEIKSSDEFTHLCPSTATCMQINVKQALSVKLFTDGFNCAQSTLVPFALQMGLNKKTTLSLATGFGSGMVYRAETCGVVTGSMMAIGLFTGRTKAEDTDARDLTYMLINQFIKRFTEKNGSIVCKKLLNLEDTTAESWANVEEEGVFEKKCPYFVKEATAITEKILKNYTNKSSK